MLSQPPDPVPPPRAFREGQTLRFRPATPADIDVLRALADSIWRANYPGIISGAQIDYMLARMYAPAQIAAEMAAGVSWEFAEVGGIPVGFIATELRDGVLKLAKLYLESAWHGKGFGQALLARVSVRAGELGAREIQLFVNRNNHAAVRAYLRAGFQIVEELDQPFGEFVLNDYRMKKEVS